MEPQQVYRAIASVASALAKQGIAKTQTNQEQGYRFRGIDDIYNHLGPLLARHRLCILPRMLARECSQLRSVKGEPLFSVTVKAAFDIISAKDGSCHRVETYGEGLDASDKATSKAMSAAYKYAAIQAFCIPTGEDNDGDQRTHRVSAVPLALAPPAQGWMQWVEDLSAVVASCETEDALSRLQLTYRAELRALSSCDRKLYDGLGSIIQARRLTLRKPSKPAAGGSDADDTDSSAERLMVPEKQLPACSEKVMYAAD